MSCEKLGVPLPRRIFSPDLSDNTWEDGDVVGDVGGGNLEAREKGDWRRRRERWEEEREQHRCQGFPVQRTETQANTTIRMSGEDC